MAHATLQNNGVTFLDNTGTAVAVFDYTGFKVGATNIVPQVSTVTMNMGGPFANVPIQVTFCRVGKEVTVSFPILNQTTTSANFITSDTTIPANCITQTPQSLPFITTSAGVASMGMIMVCSGAAHNTFIIYNTLTTNNFATATAGVGWQPQSITYSATDLP